MLREVESLVSSARSSDVAQGASQDSIESEINRLTWSVLDGSATPLDRRRLAELVRLQHARRPRINA